MWLAATVTAARINLDRESGELSSLVVVSYFQLLQFLLIFFPASRVAGRVLRSELIYLREQTCAETRGYRYTE